MVVNKKLRFIRLIATMLGLKVSYWGDLPDNVRYLRVDK